MIGGSSKVAASSSILTLAANVVVVYIWLHDDDTPNYFSQINEGFWGFGEVRIAQGRCKDLVQMKHCQLQNAKPT